MSNFAYFAVVLCLVRCAGPASQADPARDPSTNNSPPIGYPQTSDLLSRLDGREFPSLFAPWATAENFNDNLTGNVTPITEAAAKAMARHDLIWKGIDGYGVVPPNGVPRGLAQNYTPPSIAKALLLRNAILKINPHAILVAEIRYYSDPDGYLPADSPWWLRDANGNRVPDSSNGQNPTNYYRLDFHRADFQAQVAKLCHLAMQTGVVDGCFLDWWGDDTSDQDARLAIAKQVRAALGDSGLLIVNVNGRIPFASSQPYINGLYMEGYNSSFFPVAQWQQAVAIMQLAQSGFLKSPAFSAFEGWTPGDVPNRSSYPMMRMTTAMSLVFSNGFLLYGDPDPLPTSDHLHDIYVPFWSDLSDRRPLGRPRHRPATIAEKDGSYRREFSNGTVVFNPPGNATVTATFKSDRISLGSGKTGKTFGVVAGDGDIFVFPAAHRSRAPMAPSRF